jgi:hypothetical protein
MVSNPAGFWILFVPECTQKATKVRVVNAVKDDAPDLKEF